MEPKAEKIKKNSLFFREFFPSFIYLSTVVVAFIFLATVVLLSSHWKESTSAMIMILGLVLVAGCTAIALLVRVFYGVLRKLDRTLEKEDLFLQKHLSHESKGFTENLSYIITDYASSTRRETGYQLLQKQAQFDALQNQINPHFLYNTLDSIRGKALEDGSVVTAEMLEHLASLFRYSIGSSTELVKLKEELENIQSFFKIQKYRFGDRYEMVIEIAPDSSKNRDFMEKIKIPKLSLQPLVENALYHGLGGISKGGCITVLVSQTQVRTEISISDNGKGMTIQELETLNASFLAEEYTENAFSVDPSVQGIGLRNINARIKFSFGKEYGLVAYSAPKMGTEVVLTLPAVVSSYA